MDRKKETSVEIIFCDLCGLSKRIQEIELQSRTGKHLCIDCLAEENSCGCSDD